MKEKEYEATVQYKLKITSTNKDTAEYLARQSIPKHINNSTAGKDGIGTAVFVDGSVVSVSVQK